jgi:hypothetical protein
VPLHIALPCQTVRETQATTVRVVVDEIHSHDGILFNNLWCQYALSVFLKPTFLSWLKNVSNQEKAYNQAGLDKNTLSHQCRT